MISIVIPTFKRPDLLERLLDSVYAQTYQDYEVIVVDDASPNVGEYASIIETAERRFEKFQFVEMDSNGGAPRARNEGIKRAAGDWVALVDDDDEWLPAKLELQSVMAETADDNVGLIYTWTRVVGANGNVISESTPEIEGMTIKEIFSTNFILSPSVMVRRQALEEASGYDEQLSSCQDWDMWARILEAGWACKVVRSAVSVYHQHGGDSIGLSERALDGYRLFLQKHWRSIIRYTGPLNWLKKLLLFIKASHG